jgi:hypothetical protein
VYWRGGDLFPPRYSRWYLRGISRVLNVVFRRYSVVFHGIPKYFVVRVFLGKAIFCGGCGTFSQTGAQKIPAKPAGSDPFIILEAQEQRSGVCPGHCGFRILSPARLRLLRRPAGLGRVSAEGAGPCASPIASPSRRIGACGGRRGRRVSGEAGRWREGGGTEGRLSTRFAAKSPVFKNDIFGRNHYSPHCHSEGTNRLRLVFRWPERVIRRQSARLGRLRRRLVASSS